MSQENPCVSCSVDQGCCSHLDGLRVNQDEMDRCFAKYEDQLIIESDGPFFKITVKENGACPNWKEQCSIYDERPMECRLYPHTIGTVFDEEKVILTVHKRTECPQKSLLAMPDKEAFDMVTAFAQKSLGADRKFEVILEEGPARLGVFARRALRKITG